MRFDSNLYIAGTGAYLPPSIPVAPAVAAGLTDEFHSDLGYESVAVSDTMAAPDMAIAAGRIAVGRSGIPNEDFGLVLHTSLWFQGLDMWASASYVAHETVGRAAVAFDVQQRSNGGLGGFHLATMYLNSGAARAALVTTGDRFAEPAFDRWNSEFYSLFGDGGTALVLSREKGFAKVLSSAMVADNTLEPWGRGSTALGTAPG